MMARIKKAAGGLKTTTATASHNATDFIAACAGSVSATGYFCLKPGAGMGRQEYRAVKGRDRIHSGASHTTDTAGNLPDSEVFSRPEFVSAGLPRLHGFGAGSAYPQGRQHGCIHVTIPSSTFWPSQSDGGFQSHTGARTMTTVNTPTTPTSGNTSPLTRQQAIESALSGALHHARHGDLHTATGRAIRAASMLKQACAELQIGGAA